MILIVITVVLACLILSDGVVDVESSNAEQIIRIQFYLAAVAVFWYYGMLITGRLRHNVFPVVLISIVSLLSYAFMTHYDNVMKYSPREGGDLAYFLVIASCPLLIGILTFSHGRTQNGDLLPSANEQSNNPYYPPNDSIDS